MQSADLEIIVDEIAQLAQSKKNFEGLLCH